MRRVIFYFLILLFAVLVGLALKVDPGYVLLAYRHWTVEMPLWFGVILFCLIFLLVYYLFKFWGSLRTTTKRFALWRERRLFRQATTDTGKGLLALVEGYWESAEDLLIRGVKNSSLPVINYLFAAYAANELEGFERRDHYLAQARICSPEDEIAISLEQAQLQMSKLQWKNARISLQHLHNLVPRHVYVLRLLREVYIQLNAWPEVLKMFPLLKKYKVVEGSSADDLEREIYHHLLIAAGTILEAESIWEKIPRDLKLRYEIVYPYSQLLIKNNRTKEALQIVTTANQKLWDDRLVDLYGSIESTDARNQLKVAEEWLRKYEHNASLLRALGRLSLRCALYDKAETYLEKSLSLDENTQTLMALSLLYAIQNKSGKMIKMVQRALYVDDLRN